MKGKWSYLVVILAVLGYFGGRYIYFYPKYDDGDVVRDFSATLVDSSEFQLSDLRGSYVLLDFWGSWCGPCRVENPGLVQLYKDYNSGVFENASGFHIVSIALESSERSWKAAIARDGLYWKYHIGEFNRFRSPLAQLYGVRELPTKYLLGPDGEVILVNPGVGQIRDTLENLAQAAKH